MNGQKETQNVLFGERESKKSTRKFNVVSRHVLEERLYLLMGKPLRRGLQIHIHCKEGTVVLGVRSHLAKFLSCGIWGA